MKRRDVLAAAGGAVVAATLPVANAGAGETYDTVLMHNFGRVRGRGGGCQHGLSFWRRLWAFSPALRPPSFRGWWADRGC